MSRKRKVEDKLTGHMHTYPREAMVLCNEESKTGVGGVPPETVYACKGFLTLTYDILLLI